ncbi:hypothetical protein GARC_2386 [Paraglaciecola arctica BSs20135]|uniref:Uncharacterized protein n=1 Tax=Paraglaciecola arctica BSs20135 TaxID=493475 RepID=K6YMG1_9ALTE|nr:hypothetical protein GARC_2386 [Paraglaciecola arctica BSs20135]
MIIKALTPTLDSIYDIYIIRMTSQYTYNEIPLFALSTYYKRTAHG